MSWSSASPLPAISMKEAQQIFREAMKHVEARPCKIAMPIQTYNRLLLMGKEPRHVRAIGRRARCMGHIERGLIWACTEQWSRFVRAQGRRRKRRRGYR